MPLTENLAKHRTGFFRTILFITSDQHYVLAVGFAFWRKNQMIHLGDRRACEISHDASRYPNSGSLVHSIPPEGF
jgi:hypothetical protein